MEPKSLVVFHIITRMGAGGVPLQVLTTVRQLMSYGLPGALVVGTCSPGEEDVSYVLRDTDPVIHVQEMQRGFNPVADLRAFLHLLRLVRRHRPLIVHTHMAKAGMLGRLVALVCRVPVVVHTFHGNVLSGYFPEPVSVLIRLVERLQAKWTDAICVVSPQQKEEISTCFKIAPKDEVHLIPLGLDLARFAAVPTPQPENNKLTVGWFGRLAPIKDVPLLVSSIAATLKRSDRIRFLVAGDGQDRKLIEDATRRFSADQLQFLGWQKDTRFALSQCHLMLQTSRNEGTPGALIEGMAARRPFVSTAAGGVVDLVCGANATTLDGTRWYSNAVITPADPQAIATALCTFADKPSLIPDLGNAAQRFVLDRFSEAQMIANTARLYHRLAGDYIARKSSSRSGQPDQMSAFLNSLSRSISFQEDVGATRPDVAVPVLDSFSD
jgi:glycosyltransferase involved in cell wall biosynthesis